MSKRGRPKGSVNKKIVKEGDKVEVEYEGFDWFWFFASILLYPFIVFILLVGFVSKFIAELVLMITPFINLSRIVYCMDRAEDDDSEDVFLDGVVYYFDDIGCAVTNTFMKDKSKVVKAKKILR